MPWQKDIDGQVFARKGKQRSAVTSAGKGVENKKDGDIKVLENVSTHTVSHVRELFVEEGLEAALNRKPHKRSKPRRLDGAQLHWFARFPRKSIVVSKSNAFPQFGDAPHRSNSRCLERSTS